MATGISLISQTHGSQCHSWIVQAGSVPAHIVRGPKMSRYEVSMAKQEVVIRCAIGVQDLLGLGFDCGTENYKVWVVVVQLALHTRNKSGFITGTCVRSPDNAQLQDHAPKVKKYAQVFRLMQFLMGLDDVFGSIRSIILTTKPLPDIKSAFVILSKDESYRNSHVASKTVKFGPNAFAARTGNNNWNSNRNNNNNSNNYGNNNNRRFGRVLNLVCKHCNMTGHTANRCFELVGYPPGFKRNNVGQNNSNNVFNSDNKIDRSKSSPHTLTYDQYLMTLLSDACNASKSHASVAVKQIESYKLGNDLIIKDVLVVLGYHNLTQKFLMRTGIEIKGLYFFDKDRDKSAGKRETGRISQLLL
nr:ribonuclease H-like domain-containing protein [Tanacetum cinerariifolium]